MMTIMRMRCAILTIAYFIYAVFADSVISEGFGKVVRHERAWCYIESVRNCTRDGGGPPGAGFQEQAPNHLKLRW